MSSAVADPVTTTLIPSRTATILLSNLNSAHGPILGHIAVFRHYPRQHKYTPPAAIRGVIVLSG